MALKKDSYVLCRPTTSSSWRHLTEFLLGSESDKEGKEMWTKKYNVEKKGVRIEYIVYRVSKDIWSVLMLWGCSVCLLKTRQLLLLHWDGGGADSVVSDNLQGFLSSSEGWHCNIYTYYYLRCTLHIWFTIRFYGACFSSLAKKLVTTIKLMVCCYYNELVGKVSQSAGGGAERRASRQVPSESLPPPIG